MAREEVRELKRMEQVHPRGGVRARLLAGFFLRFAFEPQMIGSFFEKEFAGAAGGFHYGLD